MSNKFIRGVCAGGLWLAIFSASSLASELPALSLSPDDRVLVLAPHPDDEVIACGGVIQRALAAHIPLQVVFLTYGDNNQWSFAVYRKHPVLEPAAVRRMGLIRHDEALAADKLLGLSQDQLSFLGYPDFGTLHIWQEHWGDQPPFQSMLTKVTQVPYTNAFQVGAAYKGDEILGNLESILAEFRPTKIFLSHPADHNPDHRSLYLFTRVALWNLQFQPEVELLPYLVHYKKWPAPRAYEPSAALNPAFSLDATGGWKWLSLTSNEVATKEAALRQHKTQYAYAAKYLDSFVRQNELFGDYPAIRIRDTGSAGKVELGEKEPAAELFEELTDEEKAAFVGIETRHVWRESDTLVMELDFSRSFAPAVEAQIEFFGYRKETPFSAMPKCMIRVGEFGHRVFDQQRLLPKSNVQVSRTPRQIQIRIPLRNLGNPDRILTSGRTYLGDVPLDWTSWRILEIAPPEQAP
jgi:LmbE family N-acetylglucosaminyl deacetylase